MNPLCLPLIFISFFVISNACFAYSWQHPKTYAFHARGITDSALFTPALSSALGSRSSLTLLQCASFSLDDGSGVGSGGGASAPFTSSYASAIVTDARDRFKARSVVESVLCPPSEERDRTRAGMEAWGVDPSKPISNDDPRNEFTYGEFPIESFDRLMDRAMELAKDRDRSNDGKNQQLFDVGSGCGRLVLHAALTRGGGDREAAAWDVHGIEIGESLHRLATSSLERGVELGWFATPELDEDETITRSSPTVQNSCVVLHNGDINDLAPVLFSDASVIFAYSSVWECESQFNTDLGAMVLAAKWSKMFADACPDGCVAVTTDRVLNPEFGWKLVDRMDVENPNLCGSTGYISVLAK